MSKIRVTVHDDVRRDIAAACGYLRERSASAPEQFVAAYDRALETIELFPLAGLEIFAGYRRKTVRGFGYAVVYRVLDDEARVLAVVSMRRDPDVIAAEVDQRD